MEQEQSAISAEPTAIVENEQPESRSESISTAIDRAFKTVDDRARTPEGKFAKVEQDPQPEQQAAPEAPKPEATKFDPPTRFSPDAKAAWAAAPEPVKAEINRAIKELEGGLREYQDKWAPLKQYDELARQVGTTIDKAMANYVGIERQLAQDPVKGLEIVCQNMGLSLREVAAHVLGQPSNDNQTISELRRELSELRNQVGGVTSTIKTQTEQQTLREIAEFSKDKPRFDELAGDIAFFIQAGRAKGLDDAYQLAERLNPAPQPPAPSVQPKKANLSMSGSPASGSTPAGRMPSSSVSDSVARAFANAGL